ncbi:MAG: DUF1772 domain-containing protein [Acidimicrobiia bacterium]|nr:DUF1772 domain-containing protein [Acidimicrobiia bacterium]
MIEGYRYWLTVAGAAGSGLIGGLFFAFSSFAMSGLRRLPGRQGLVAMQSINTAANASPGLLVGLLGTGALCVAIAVPALGDLDRPASRYQLAASLLYLVGAIGVTAAYHIPKNNALDRVDPDSAGAVATWEHYAATWTAGNHVRTVLPLAAAVCFALALRAR